MAPTSGNKKAKAIQGSKLSRRPSGDTRDTSSKPKKSKSSGKAPPPKQVKSKPRHGPQPKKKKRVYSDKELDIPVLNMITPAGVQKPRGKKKGKVFVDDQVRMPSSNTLNYSHVSF
jgi:60S ribosomal subunit assembly/export protein LOC1